MFDDIVLYIEENKILLTTCSNITNIDILEQNQECYKDAKIRFTENNREITAYLTDQNIISDKTTKINCNETKYIQLKNSNIYIMMHNKQTHMMETRQRTIDFGIKLDKDITFTHNEQLLENIELADEIKDLTNYQYNKQHDTHNDLVIGPRTNEESITNSQTK